MCAKLLVDHVQQQATAHGSTQGLQPGTSDYWKALQPHRKLDEVI